MLSFLSPTFHDSSPGSLWFTPAPATILGLAGRLVVTGLGFGLFQAPNLSEILRGLPPNLIGLVASTNAVLKNLGALLGITVMVTVFAWFNLHRAWQGPAAGLQVSSFHQGFAVATLLGGLSLLTNPLPRRRG